MDTHLKAAETALRAGDPKAALASLTEAVRAQPGDAKLRTFLAQLLCVLGQWQRAHAQLNVMAELDKLAIPMRETFGHALRCELMREQVFAGQRVPQLFGDPPPWVPGLVESLHQAAEGDSAQATELATKAFEAAPALTGTIDGQAFAWLADADSRLGPVLEAVINGHYNWVPFQHLSRIDFDPPTDLRDQVWLPAELTLHNGGKTVALVPTCYVGSHHSSDGLICMARKTEWLAQPGERWFGLGQRVFSSDVADHDLLSIRHIVFDAPA
jgi:type VI secretion system protein ImpE